MKANFLFTSRRESVHWDSAKGPNVLLEFAAVPEGDVLGGNIILGPVTRPPADLELGAVYTVTFEKK